MSKVEGRGPIDSPPPCLRVTFLAARLCFNRIGNVCRSVLMQYPKPLLHYCVFMHLHLVLHSVTVSAHLYYLVGGSAEDVIHLHSLRFNGTKTNCRIEHILVIIH